MELPTLDPNAGAPAAFTVEAADWAKDQAELRAVRRAVFVEEQEIPAELEWDGRDPDCRHLLAREAGPRRRVVGTTRVTPAGQIGRMAVLPAWRGRGVGSALLDAAVRICRARPGTTPYLHAQQSACGFYRRFGFQAQGPGFETAGIPHQAMVLPDRTEPAAG